MADSLPKSMTDLEALVTGGLIGAVHRPDGFLNFLKVTGVEGVMVDGLWQAHFFLHFQSGAKVKISIEEIQSRKENENE